MKNNHRSNNGSIILMILIVFTSVTVILYSALRTSLYAVSLANEREKCEQHYQLAYSLYSFVIIHYADDIKKSYDLNNVSKKIIYHDCWPNQDSNYKGLVFLEKEAKASWIIHVSIEKNNIVYYSLSFPFLCDSL